MQEQRKGQGGSFFLTEDGEARLNTDKKLEENEIKTEREMILEERIEVKNTYLFYF